MCELSGAQSVLKFQILPFPTPKLTPEGEEEEDNDIYIEHLLGTASSDFAPTHYFREAFSELPDKVKLLPGDSQRSMHLHSLQPSQLQFHISLCDV